MLIKPDNLFPAIIIGLLIFGVSSSFTLLYFAKSDDGPQVIPDYYERSIDYGTQYQAREDSIQLGWTIDVTLNDEVGEFTVFDSHDQAVNGIVGNVTFFRPSKALPIDSVPLNISGDGTSGRYQFSNIADQSGLWDLAIELQRGDQIYVDKIRVDIDR